MFVLISITKSSILPNFFDVWKEWPLAQIKKRHFGMMQRQVQPELDCGLLARDGGDGVPTVCREFVKWGWDVGSSCGANPPK